MDKKGRELNGQQEKRVTMKSVLIECVGEEKRSKLEKRRSEEKPEKEGKQDSE